MAIVKELQTTAAFKARETFHERESMRKTELIPLMKDSFHGNEGKDIASQAKLLYQGQGAYASLYEDLDSVTDANASTDISSQVRPLKKLLTNDTKSLHTVGPREKEDITLSLLKRKTKKSPGAVPGKTLYDAAFVAHANGRKALAFGESYLNSRKDNPSGTNANDYFAYVFSKMYKDSEGRMVATFLMHRAKKLRPLDM